MAVNFLATLNNPASMSAKQREQLAQQNVLKLIGAAFYGLPLAERARLRQVELDKLNGEGAQRADSAGNDIALRATPDTDKQEADTPAVVSTFPANTVAIEANKQVGDTEAKALAPEPAPANLTVAAIEQAAEQPKKQETFALDIVLNSQQQLGADFAEAGKCFVYTGAAGTGKTTGCREIAKKLLKSGKLVTHDFKIPRGGGRVYGPSIAICAYTNRATNNMRRALHKDPELEEALRHNVITIHGLLEFEPIFFDREDGTVGMRFEPQRHAGNKLRITHLVIEEASMLGIALWLQLLDALQPGVQIIFVGDINQLQPPFSRSVLNYALIGLPVVELNEVYRQALDSPIIRNAHRCLKGESLEQELPFFRVTAGKNINKIPSEIFCVQMLVNSLKKWNTQVGADGQLDYDPEQDIVLSPFNVNDAGTISLNNHIAQFLGQKRNAMVFEIIAGMRKVYLAEGDRVMIDKQDGIVKRIVHNGRYIGRMPIPASTELTRFGIRLLGSSKLRTDEDLEFVLQGYENLDVSAIPDEDDEKRKQEASHLVDVELDDGRVVTLDKTGDFNEQVFSLGYALTVHKAQGCEWRKVFILMHKNHAVGLCRELLYTAITRAREYVHIIDLCNVLDRTIATQRIKGNSIKEKIEWFNSEVSLAEPVPLIP